MSSSPPPSPPSPARGPSASASVQYPPRPAGPSVLPCPRPSPILTHRPLVDGPDAKFPSDQPQYAETLTPLKLRRRRGQRPVIQPLPEASVVPPFAGPSTQGYYTATGDLYRGSRFDPTATNVRWPQCEEDAVTLGGSSSTSSSSIWSWGSGNLERGRRATMAVIGRFGEALGVRRGSNSPTGSDGGSVHHAGGQSQIGRKRSRRFSRSTTTETSPERPRRQYLPKRREFTLLLPPKDGLLSRTSTPRDSLASSNVQIPPTVYPPDRLVKTPSLPVVIEHIRSIRLASGYLPLSTPPSTPNPQLPVQRGGSPPSRSPRPNVAGATSFVHPHLRPSPHRSQSRLQALRGQSSVDVPRPKSVSDLMGIVNPYGSTPNLTAMQSSDFAMHSRVSTPLLSSNQDSGGGWKGKEKGCWWLDVACPTLDDLRDLGELLDLHPLTLEDVLHQDPREKLDTFDRLGYYFVVVRALDEGYFKYTPGSSTTPVGAGQAVEKIVKEDGSRLEGQPSEESVETKKEGRRRGWGMGRASGKSANKEGEKVEIVEDNPGKEGLEGVGVGAVNVYLVVFADGIVSFHSEDISKHTKRVLDRVLSDASARGAASSDWVAHGLLDSIVDAFFPLIRYVDGEVDDIDSLTIDPTTDPKATTAALEASSPVPTESNDGIELNEKLSIGSSDTMRLEKPKKTWLRPKSSVEYSRHRQLLQSLKSAIPSLDFSLPRPFVYIRLFFLPTSSAITRKHRPVDDNVYDRPTMLKRITDMRQLMTGLTRLLGAKHQVIGKLRKRAAEGGGGVEAYIGDVEDHVLLLQTSLYHYEYILSHCQPAYLSHLSVSFTFARGRTDQAVLALSTVAIGILPMQFVVGLFSTNLHLPANGQYTSKTHKNADGTPSAFHWFAGVVIAIFLVACCVVTLIRWWRWQARRKWARIRGMDVPDAWDGYWGWK